MPLTEAEKQRVWDACYEEAADMSTKEVAHLIFDAMNEDEMREFLKMLDEGDEGDEV